MGQKTNINSKPDFQKMAFGQYGSRLLSGTEASVDGEVFKAITALEASVVTLVQERGDVLVQQVETATVVGTITGDGNATVIVTSAGMAGSPITLSVAVLTDDTPAEVAVKIKAAMDANAAIGHPTTGKFTVTVDGADVILTANDAAANDTTLNVDINNGTCTGLTDAPTSTSTTEGSLSLPSLPMIAGLTVYGSFSSITMVSGTVLAYIG